MQYQDDEQHAHYQNLHVKSNSLGRVNSDCMSNVSQFEMRSVSCLCSPSHRLFVVVKFSWVFHVLHSCRPKRIGCCPRSSVIILVLRAGLGNSECHRRSNSCKVCIIEFNVVPSEPICVQMANTRKLRHLQHHRQPLQRRE